MSPNKQKKTHIARRGGGDAYIGGAGVGSGGALGSPSRHAASPRAPEILAAAETRTAEKAGGAGRRAE